MRQHADINLTAEHIYACREGWLVVRAPARAKNIQG
jgi:hypothetical protein